MPNSFWPRKTADRLSWSLAQVQNWTAHAVEIGSTPADVADFAAKVAQMQADYKALQSARLELAAKAQALRQSVAEAHLQASAIVSQVGAKAKTDRDDGAYTLAGLSVPGSVWHSRTPEQPTGLHASFDAMGGSARLEWRGNKSNTAFFTVWRRTDSGGLFVQIGATDEKWFVDRSLPADARQATYYVRAHKGQRESPPSEITQIIFGPHATQQAA